MPRALRTLLLLTRLGVALGVSTSLLGCGFEIDIVKHFKKKKKSDKKQDRDDDDDDDEPRKKPKEDPKGTVELGLASFPNGATTPVALHQWKAVRLVPNEYKLEYAISTEEQKKILGAHHRFAEKTRYTDLGEGRFRWFIPPGCEQDMGCAFGAMTDASREAMKPLVKLFKERAKKADMNSDQVANLIVTFVQQIRYERPKDQPFEILPPANVVAEKRGDCDSKSLLAHLLLREFGIDSVMLSSRAHGHAMLGIAIPAPGKRFSFGGRTYAFTELTAANSPIGHINPELTRPDDWKIVPTRWPESSWDGKGRTSDAVR